MQPVEVVFTWVFSIFNDKAILYYCHPCLNCLLAET